MAKGEVPPRSFGKRVSLILAPDKTKIEAIKRKEAKEAAAKEKEAGVEKAAAEAPAEEKAEA